MLEGAVPAAKVNYVTGLVTFSDKRSIPQLSLKRPFALAYVVYSAKVDLR